MLGSCRQNCSEIINQRDNVWGIKRVGNEVVDRSQSALTGEAITDAKPQSRILDSCPEQVKSVVLTYAHEAGLSSHVVVQLMMAQFLELDAFELEHPQNLIDDISLLSELPTVLQTHIRHYAEEVEMPPEFVIALAITHFIDPDAVTFDDCQLSINHVALNWLKRFSCQF